MHGTLAMRMKIRGPFIWTVSIKGQPMPPDADPQMGMELSQ